MVLSFVVEPQILQAQDVQMVNYIQNTPSETVELAANNLLGGEIYTYQEGNYQNFSDNTPQLISFSLRNDYLINTKSLLKGSFIHTLSTNLKEVKQIRAP